MTVEEFGEIELERALDRQVRQRMMSSGMFEHNLCNCTCTVFVLFRCQAVMILYSFVPSDQLESRALGQATRESVSGRLSISDEKSSETGLKRQGLIWIIRLQSVVNPRMCASARQQSHTQLSLILIRPPRTLDITRSHSKI